MVVVDKFTKNNYNKERKGKKEKDKNRRNKKKRKERRGNINKFVLSMTQTGDF